MALAITPGATDQRLSGTCRMPAQFVSTVAALKPVSSKLPTARVNT
jgi:hypothetical protein